MKTAAQHLHNLESFLHPTEAWVKQIQLDAYKAGMTEAAEMVGTNEEPDFACRDVCDNAVISMRKGKKMEILAARDIKKAV